MRVGCFSRKKYVQQPDVKCNAFNIEQCSSVKSAMKTGINPCREPCFLDDHPQLFNFLLITANKTSAPSGLFVSGQWNKGYFSSF